MHFFTHILQTYTRKELTLSFLRCCEMPNQHLPSSHHHTHTEKELTVSFLRCCEIPNQHLPAKTNLPTSHNLPMCTLTHTHTHAHTHPSHPCTHTHTHTHTHTNKALTVSFLRCCEIRFASLTNNAVLYRSFLADDFPPLPSAIDGVLAGVILGVPIRNFRSSSRATSSRIFCFSFSSCSTIRE